MKDLNKVLKGFAGRKILVLGDVMLDHYIWGKVERISPEAPVPVLEVQRDEYRLGGAANVALNLRALGSEPLLCGVLGSDIPGAQFTALLAEKNIRPSGLITNSKCRTTLKQRIGSHNQQIVRVDFEETQDIPANLEKRVLSKLEKYLPRVEALIIEDYNKGLLTARVIRQAVDMARGQNIPVLVDPKQKNFFLYENTDVFKPNYGEMQKNLGRIFANEEEFNGAARQLKARLKCRYLVVTRGERGLYVYSNNEETHRIPTFAREIYDVSGAGDTVISALALALCSGCDIREAAVIANHAAGIVCGKIGTATATVREIRQSIYEHGQDN